MHSPLPHHGNKKVLIIIGVTIVFAGAIGYGYVRSLRAEQQLTAAIDRLDVRIATLEEALHIVSTQKDALTTTLEVEQQKSASLGEKIQQITGTVEVLEKLSKTDAELLQKYSKVYFLNEHYVPDVLADIATAYVVPEGRTLKVHAKVEPYLSSLLKSAARDDLQLRVVSAYRSFEEQKDLKSAYTVTYGTGANKFSADQGYSEHQLGTTVDFGTATVTSANSKFESTPEYQWLLKNAYRYGFTLSYPANNSYYKFEPWHWRFVGLELAEKLQKNGEHLYDLDQREIDTYLVNIFE